MRYCSECKKEKKESYCDFCKKDTSSNYVMHCSPGVYKVRMPAAVLRHKRPGIKRPLREVCVGWKSSGDKIKHPDGINIGRVIDRVKNQYEEKVTDEKTGKIVRDISEPLDQHLKKREEKN